jgi:hypothetical protein
MQPLESAILRTVAYFDLFRYPLTSWEIWKWGIGRAGELYSYRAVEQALQESALLQEKLELSAGFIFLRGRSALVKDRQERYRLALQKLDRAKRFTRTLVRIPFIRAVFTCNSLGIANARAESDIDFFVIVRKGHVWAVRLLAAGWAKLRKLRPVPGNRADKFCLSFFLADDAFELSSLRLPADPYLTMWVATLVPIFDPENLNAALWQANPWVQQVLPNAAPRDLAQQRHVRRPWFASFLALLLRPLVLERLAERLQRRTLAPNLRELANRDTRVVLNDRMLKFHDNDRRQEYAEAFAARLGELGV